MRIDGGCHCGRIRYEAEIDPDAVSVCHCTDCQTLASSPFRVTVYARREAIHLTGAIPRIYLKMGESGRRRRQHFCEACGAPLFASGDPETGTWGIRWGGIRQRDQLVPRRQIWCRSAAPWLETVQSLPGHETE